MMKTKKLNKACLQISIYFITLFISLIMFSAPVIKLYTQFAIQPFMTGHTAYNYFNSRIRLLTAQVLPSEIRFYNSLDNYFNQAKEIFILPSYIENAFSCCVGSSCNNFKNKTSCKLERLEDRLGELKDPSSYKFFSKEFNLTGASDIFISTNGLANINKNIKFKHYSFNDTCCIYENCKDYFSTNKSYQTPCKIKEVQEVLKYKLNSDSIYQIIFSQADLESRSDLAGLKDIVPSSLKPNFWSWLGTVLAGTYGIFTFGLSLFIVYLLSTLFICLTIFILLKVQNYLFNTSFKLANKIVFKNQECDKFHIVLFYFIIGFILWFTFYLTLRFGVDFDMKSISKERESILLYFILFITLILKLTTQFIQKDKYKDSKWSCFRLLTLSYPLFFYSFIFGLEIIVKSSNTSLENILFVACTLFFYFMIFLLHKLSHGTGSLTSQMVKLINNKNGFKDIGSLFVFILKDLTIPFFFGSFIVALLQLSGLLNVLFQYLKI